MNQQSASSSNCCATNQVETKTNHQTQAKLEQTKQLIAATNTELVHRTEKASTAPVDLHLEYDPIRNLRIRDNSNNEAVRNAAADALALYKRGQNEFKITVGSVHLAQPAWKITCRLWNWLTAGTKTKPRLAVPVVTVDDNQGTI